MENNDRNEVTEILRFADVFRGEFECQMQKIDPAFIGTRNFVDAAIELYKLRSLNSINDTLAEIARALRNRD